MIDAIDLIVTAALKAASSEVVKKSIGAISGRLAAAIEDRNHDEVKKIIKEEGVEEQVAKIAQAGIENSVVFSVNQVDLSSPVYKTELFLRVMELGFRVSAENKVDVLLSGSLVGRGTLSVFSTREYVPSLEKTGVSVAIKGSQLPVEGYYAILPADTLDGDVVYRYKSAIREKREESLSDYILSPKLIGDDSWVYCLNNVTAGSIYYKYASKASQLTKQLSLDGRVKISDFALGIRSMLDDIKDYPSIPHLSKRDRDEITSILEEMKNLGV